MSRFLLRGLLLTVGIFLLLLTGLVSAARRADVEPYYLEFSTPDLPTGALQTCRLGYYDQPQRCGYLPYTGFSRLSPDGRWRVFATINSPRGWAIYRASEFSKTGQEIIHPGEFAIIGESIWSPDGRWIAFSAFAVEGDLNIFRLELATGDIVQLTDLQGDEWYPTWSPDGQQIAFNARDTLGNAGLFIISADGSDLHEAQPGLRQSFRPQWSPDGDWLVFQSNCPEDVLLSLGELRCSATHFNLYRLRLEDGHIEPLVALPGDEYDPAWSPDGEWVAFTSRIDVTSEAGIFRIRPDGSDLQPMTSDARTSFFSPTWARTPDLAWRPIFLLTIVPVMLIVAWRMSS